MTTVREYRFVGKRIAKVGADKMVMGEAVYGADVQLPGALYGKILRSPYAHATIKRIDTSRAEALPGVKAVVTAADFPEVKPGTAMRMGEFIREMSWPALLIMARDKALYHGHPVAAVAATDPWAAEEALNLIEVEYEELPIVLDVLEAMKPEAPILLPRLRTVDVLGTPITDQPSNIALKAELGAGDVEEGFREAEVVVERTYRTGMAHQGYLEPHACTAKWDPTGRVTVWTSTQGHFGTQTQLSLFLDLPLNQIKVVGTEIGGGFGGKFMSHIEPVAVVLARKAGRPVKLTMSREEILRSFGPGSASVLRVKSSCTRDGRITALEMWTAFDAGCIPGSAVLIALVCGVAPYRIPRLKLEGYDVVTNKVAVQAYRGPGAPQGAFAVEQNIDLMAQAIEMDPIEFRMKNAVDERDVDVREITFGPIGVREILRRMKEHPHYNAPLEGANRGRGIALGFWINAEMYSSCVLSIHPDGKANLSLGSIDLTGTRTTMVQIAAEELGLSPEDITVGTADTDSAPFTNVSGGSRITYTMGTAVYRAAEDILSQAKERAAARLEARPEDIEFDQFTRKLYVRGSPEKSIELFEVALHGEGILMGRGTVAALKHHPAFAGAICDVEIDPETGKTKVLRYTAFQDVGKAINPTRVEAQMQSGAIQGLGWGLTEEYIHNDKGVLLNASLLDYRQLAPMDVPMIDTELIEVPSEEGPYGARGVGEVPIVPTMAAVANAIANAVGVRTYYTPATLERVYKAIKEARALAS